MDGQGWWAGKVLGQVMFEPSPGGLTGVKGTRGVAYEVKNRAMHAFGTASRNSS